MPTFPLSRRSFASITLSALLVLAASALIALLAPWPITVIDGDTVDKMWVRHRLVGFDAPEIRRSQCPAERELGMKAKARLAALIAAARRTELVRPPGKDRYNRTHMSVA